MAGPKYRTLEVGLGDRAYPIHVGSGILGEPETISARLAGRDTLVVTNTTVGPLYLDTLVRALGGRRWESLVLPDGEQYKTLASFAEIIDRLAELSYHRDAVVIALGGGVIGDLAGFAAACYQRGIAFVQAPTTLLAQVDAAVGGKTAVNHPAGKNLIGAFYQPQAVIADIATLETLPLREYRAGLAEVVKYGAGLDAGFFRWLEAHRDALMDRDADALTDAVLRCCSIKAAIVAEDEREAGRRALLNLGHTFAHAIETGTGYGQWLHGEAVAAGMMMAADLSGRLGSLDDDEASRLRGLLDSFGLPLTPPPLGASSMEALMAMDKKVSGGRLRLVLFEGLGASSVRTDVPRADLEAVLAAADPE
ncbi:MAG: 3-dehydroquinate synthase [Gammaproteobacteria bacterium]|jgi:3-dehydroquinate synthase